MTGSWTTGQDRKTDSFLSLRRQIAKLYVLGASDFGFNQDKASAAATAASAAAGAAVKSAKHGPGPRKEDLGHG